MSTARFRHCRNPGLNRGPLDLQSNALPTELFRPTRGCQRALLRTALRCKYCHFVSVSQYYNHSFNAWGNGFDIVIASRVWIYASISTESRCIHHFRESHADVLNYSCQRSTFDATMSRTRLIPYGLVVRIPAFHAGGPGSIPGVGASFCWVVMNCNTSG